MVLDAPAVGDGPARGAVPATGVTVFADTNGNGTLDILTHVVEPDDVVPAFDPLNPDLTITTGNVATFAGAIGSINRLLSFTLATAGPFTPPNLISGPFAARRRVGDGSPGACLLGEASAGTPPQ